MSRLGFMAQIEQLSSPKSQGWPSPAPDQELAIVIIGAGSIVHDAHGPAYQLARLPVKAIFDLDGGRAQEKAEAFGIEQVCGSLEEISEVGRRNGAVFDIALPPAEIVNTLRHIPRGSAVLIQKPIGKSLEDAREISRTCEERELIAGVNFQLPFSPQVTAAFKALRAGLIGELQRSEMTLEMKTQWSYWPFVLNEPRVEILLHSIHYISVYAHYFPHPVSVRSTSRGDPNHDKLRDKDVCSDTVITYVNPDGGGSLCFEISCDHLSEKAPEDWVSEMCLRGSRGTIRAKIADDLSYPNGVDDTLTIDHDDHGTHCIPVKGNRFPHAFIATMGLLQKAAVDHTTTGRRNPFPNDLAFGLRVMALTECSYRSIELGGKDIDCGEAELFG